MMLMRFLWRSAGKATLLMVLIGIAASGFNAGLLASVHRALIAPAGFSTAAQLTFLALLAGKLGATYLSGAWLNRHALEAVNALRNELVRKLLEAPLAQLQRVGVARVLTALTEDLARLQAALQGLSSMVVSGAVVAGGGAYLLWLSPAMFGAASALAGLTVALHLAFHRNAREHLRKSHNLHDRLFDLYHHLTGGIRELKLNRPQREGFLSRGIDGTTRELTEARLQGQTRYLQSQGATQLMLFLGIFALLLVGRSDSGALTDPGGTASGFVLAALYLVGPLTNVMRGWPVLGMASIALDHVGSIGAALDGSKPEGAAVPRQAVPTRFTRIELREVTFAHDHFRLGPIDLRLQPGQLTFVTGDNGSGKSTLALVICGLFAPTTGTLEWDGVAVDAHTRDDYRQLVSAVFFDFHLFERLWRDVDEQVEKRLADHLERVGIADKVSFQGDQPSTTELSHGQRRRLALAIALLEDRPLFVFDEFGGDQSPEFSRWFYRELLPELRAQQKAVVVITHDDRFFDLADQRISLSAGRMLPASPSDETRSAEQNH